MKRLSIALLCLILATACTIPQGTVEIPPRLPGPSLDHYDVVNGWPHDPQAFTQGLAFRNGYLYESTGLYGRSTLRRVDLRTGAVLKSVPIPDDCFAEGMTILGNRIYLLTWREERCFVYDSSTLEKVDEFYFEGEGWGLTDDGKSLIASDGTDLLRFLDPATLRETRRIMVRESNLPVINLDELEYIRGEIYAVVLMSDRIVRIDPATGNITGSTTLHQLFPRKQRPSEEAGLNGIAYDRDLDRMFVTGKLWPRLFEIRLRE
jgi:glutamine cyclotransferase